MVAKFLGRVVKEKVGETLASGLVDKTVWPALEFLKREAVATACLEGEAFMATAAALAEAFGKRSVVFGGRPAETDDDGPVPPGGSSVDPHSLRMRLATGSYFGLVDGRFVWADLNKEKFDTQWVESVTLTVARKDESWLHSWVEKKVEERSARNQGLKVKRWGGYYWETALTRPYRPVETVEHPEGAPQAMVRLAREWEATREEVVKRGENFHLGFLLHGPPGTGKTSAAIALASELKKTLCVCDPQSVKLTSVPQMVAKLPDEALLLVEECDEMFACRSRGQSEATASALSAFDGPLSKQGVVRVYTTNDIGRVDKALRRPGRVDHEFYFPPRA